MKKDILITYKNYLHALIWAKEFKNKYKDEDTLRVLEKELENSKILTKKIKKPAQDDNFSSR